MNNIFAKIFCMQPTCGHKTLGLATRLHQTAKKHGIRRNKFRSRNSSRKVRYVRSRRGL